MAASGVREAALALFVALLVIAGFSAFRDDPVIRTLETQSLDWRFRLRGIRPPGQQIAVVLVDDKSLAALGRWPLSRDLFGRAVTALDRAGAKVIGFDVLFSEPDQPVPAGLRAAAAEALSALDGTSNPEFRRSLSDIAEADPDRDFQTAIRDSGKVLLPFALSPLGPPGDAPDYIATSAYARFDKTATEPALPLRPVSALVPIVDLGEAAAGLGHVTIAYDADGAPRYDYVALPFDGDFLPSMPVRIVAAYLGVPWDQVALALGRGARIGTLLVPTDRAMRLLINYRGPRGTFQPISFVDLLEGRVPDDVLRGRIVLIGASFIGDADAVKIPFDSTPAPGVERMANVVSMMLDRDFITELSEGWMAFTLGLVLLIAATMGAAMARLNVRWAIVAAATPLLLWASAAQFAFVCGLWLPAAEPATALAAAALVVLLFRYIVVGREGRYIKSVFGRYLSPEVIESLAADPARLRLGGETRVMTVLFCDVRDFTAIAERFKTDPQALTRLINRFLTPMTSCVMAERGTIDKYIGDCVMAFWNAPLDDPNHVDHACASALAMLGALDALNRKLAEEALAEGRAFAPLDIGIGLNTGLCVVGNMGSEQRFDYSVLGDTVNLAARLEGLTKTYGVKIIIGEETRAQAPNWAALELDLITVKGKTEPARVFALLGDDAFAQSAGFQRLAQSHDRMLAQYRAGDWDAALEMIAQCRSQEPRLQYFYDLSAERISYARSESCSAP
jgi:adenylate cyclase